jgi:hypothetical protein
VAAYGFEARVVFARRGFGLAVGSIARRADGFEAGACFLALPARTLSSFEGSSRARSFFGADMR